MSKWRRELIFDLRPIPEQISELAKSYPHSIALSYGNKQLNYAILNEKADRFASYLRLVGSVPGSTVAVCMNRSFDWIVAILGSMRAGAAYVPLDPAWPDERLRYAVNDSGARFLVSHGTLLDRLSVRTECIDPYRDAAKIAASPEAEAVSIRPKDLAYVIYTSGSSGLPKGVEITHANLLHLIRWHHDAFDTTQKDRASHLAGLGFDAAGWEIWPYLSVGATVCLVDDKVRSAPELIQQWMVRERVTVGFVPTVHAVPMMSMEWPPATSLRFLLTGGDTLPSSPRVGLPFKVVNNYGPTECTVVATSSVLQPGSPERPPIGRPIAGASIYLLNEDGHEVPDGSIGEIYIGGAGVGAGYRNLPDLTQRYFLHDPFSAEATARMYRTGDRGVRRENGEIDFRGRLDRQTKIRGQRVELDEIGSVLAQHPGVGFATAINISRAEENQLVAYVLPKESVRVPTLRELQNYLGRTLPDYMVPAIFVRLYALPLSSNGKLDLTMLPQPSDANLLKHRTETLPASPVEGELLTLVRQVLSNDEVMAQDSFFLAGGHSLLGMQLLVRLRDIFGVDLTLRQLFEAPTVERLAVLIENIRCDSITSGQKTNAIFWVQSQAANLAMVFGKDPPLFSVALTVEDFGPLGEQPELPTIAACLLRKIRQMQPRGPYRIGGFCLGGILAYEIASQLRSVGQEVSLLVLLSAPNPACLDSCDSWDRKVNYLRYAWKRGMQQGLRRTLSHVYEHLHKGFVRIVGTETYAHQLANIAADSYRPPKYDGIVLLLLASQRPPHVNYVPGWQAVVTGRLYTHYIDAHHRDLLKSENVKSVAAAIMSHLPRRDNEPLGDLV